MNNHCIVNALTYYKIIIDDSLILYIYFLFWHAIFSLSQFFLTWSIYTPLDLAFKGPVDIYFGLKIPKYLLKFYHR